MSFDHIENQLPYDGEVYYCSHFFDACSATKHFDILSKTVPWQQDQAIIFGKTITTRRKTAWYGDQQFPYTYSKIKRIAHHFTPHLNEIKAQIENVTHTQFNSCLLNYYHDGDDGMGYHADAERELRKNGVIASLSLGCRRKFSFKHKFTKQRIDLYLDHGSLLIMKAQTQSFWQHCLPKSKQAHNPRINLTFRQFTGYG